VLHKKIGTLETLISNSLKMSINKIDKQSIWHCLSCVNSMTCDSSILICQMNLNLKFFTDPLNFYSTHDLYENFETLQHVGLKVFLLKGTLDLLVTNQLALIVYLN
jgi:hypothetical protein